MKGIINRTLKFSPVQKHTGLKIYNPLALPTLLCGYKTRAIREQNKSSITTAEMKFVRGSAQYIWVDCKSNEDILSELKINPVVNKIQNYGNEWIQHVRRMDRQTATLNYESKPKTPLRRLLDH
jgi:hypothetical protein